MARGRGGVRCRSEDFLEAGKGPGAARKNRFTDAVIPTPFIQCQRPPIAGVRVEPDRRKSARSPELLCEVHEGARRTLPLGGGIDAQPMKDEGAAGRALPRESGVLSKLDIVQTNRGDATPCLADHEE